MQYQKNIKIIIDKRKLDVLERLGCPDEKIISLIKTGKFKPTGDHLIDETLECLVDIREFKNWGGNHNPTGKNQYTKESKRGQLDGQLDHQDDGQLDGQDAGQDVDIDKDKDRDIDKDIITPYNINNNNGDSSTVDNVDNSETRKEMARKIGDLIKRVPRTPFDYK